jgi:hypothetical protein
MSSPPRNDEASILSRAIAPDSGTWSPSVAHGVLSLTLSASDRDRMNELAARSRDGALGPDEQLEIESYPPGAQRCAAVACARFHSMALRIRDRPDGWSKNSASISEGGSRSRYSPSVR